LGDGVGEMVVRPRRHRIQHRPHCGQSAMRLVAHYQRGERQGRNVRTGEALTIAASKAARFLAAVRLRAAVNGKPD
jgi:hypothetical protein